MLGRRSLSARNYDWPGLVEAAAVALLGAPNPDLSRRSRGELRYGRKGSLEVRVPPHRLAGTWVDYEAGERGGVVDLVVQRRGGSRAEALVWLSESVVVGDGSPPPAGGRVDRGKRAERKDAGWFWERCHSVPLDDDHPARRWLAARSLWRNGFPLPGAVRWTDVCPRWAPGAAGAVVAMAASPGAWTSAWPGLPEAAGVQRMPVREDGSSAGDKKSLGLMAGSVLALGNPDLSQAPAAVGVCEGVADALALASRREGPVIATLGTGNMVAADRSGLAAWLAGCRWGVEIWADRDSSKDGWAPAGLKAARALAYAVEKAGAAVAPQVCYARRPHKDIADAASAAGFPWLDPAFEDCRATLTEIYPWWPPWYAAVVADLDTSGI